MSMPSKASFLFLLCMQAIQAGGCASAPDRVVPGGVADIVAPDAEPLTPAVALATANRYQTFRLRGADGRARFIQVQYAWYGHTNAYGSRFPLTVRCLDESGTALWSQDVTVFGPGWAWPTMYEVLRSEGQDMLRIVLREGDEPVRIELFELAENGLTRVELE